MKAFGLCAVLCSLAAFSAAAQQSQNMEVRQQPMVAAPPEVVIPAPTNRLQRIFGPTATYEGVLPDIRRRGNVLTRSDLSAPVVPGREFRNVSVNPHNGRAEGIILIAIHF